MMEDIATMKAAAEEALKAAREAYNETRETAEEEVLKAAWKEWEKAALAEELGAAVEAASAAYNETRETAEKEALKAAWEAAEEAGIAAAVAAEKAAATIRLLQSYKHVPPMAGQSSSSPMGVELFDMPYNMHGFNTLNGGTYTAYLRGWQQRRAQE